MLSSNEIDDYDLDHVISFPGGFVSFLDNNGIMRTERAHYDPLAGEVRCELSNSGQLADVIDMMGHMR